MRGSSVGSRKGGDRRDHAHAQLAGKRLAGGAHHVGQILGSRRIRCAFSATRIPSGVKRTTRGSARPGDADQGLQFLDPGRERRLGDEAGVGGPAEMAVVSSATKYWSCLRVGRWILIVSLDQSVQF
jgi:hypothetical protein